MGCGSTAIAAIRSNRNYIGFDISKDYTDLALRRIEKERSQISLDLD